MNVVNSWIFCGHIVNLSVANINCIFFIFHSQITKADFIDPAIAKVVAEKYLIVSVEEHNVVGGLGSAIAEHKSSLNKSPKQLFLGIKDTYTKGGNYKFLQEKHRLTPGTIAEDILLHIK